MPVAMVTDIQTYASLRAYTIEQQLLDNLFIRQDSLDLWSYVISFEHTHALTKWPLFCVRVRSSIDQLIAKPGNKTATVSWPDLYNILKCIYFSKIVWIWVKILPKFLPKDPIYNDKPALIQVMTRCLFGTKPFPEPMLTKSMTPNTRLNKDNNVLICRLLTWWLSLMLRV